MRDVVPPAAISGFVTDATSGLPLERALVVLSALEGSDQRVALADGTGYYEFSELPAGTYNLRASFADYVGRQFGLRQPLLGAVVVMSPFAGGRPAVPRPISVRVTVDGSFESLNVPPGYYVIRARGQLAGGDSVFATFQVVLLENEDVSNIHMALGPGAQLSGRVRFDATRNMPRADLTRILVSAPAIDGTMFGGEPQGQVEPDGTFRLDSVLAGERLIRVDGLPETWALQTVYYRGRDITDTPLALEKGERVRGIQLVLTDRIIRLTGTVRDENQEVVTDHTVVALSADVMLRRPPRPPRVPRSERPVSDLRSPCRSLSRRRRRGNQRERPL